MGIITQYAVPTDDHYRPLIAAMALTNADEQFEYFNDSFELGSISMRSFISTPA
jgi:4,5-DOPA dioxygenase extradiol